jgi:hypothetical protein
MQSSIYDIMAWIATFLFGLAAAGGIIGYVARMIFQHYLARDIEQYKANLKLEHTKAIETMKSDMQRAAYEHQVRFSKLHERRAEVIAELYRLLVKLLTSTQKFVEGPKPKGYSPTQQDMHELTRLGNKTMEYYLQHRLYLDTDLAVMVGDYLKKALNIFAKYLMSQDASQDHRQRGEYLVQVVGEVEGELQTLLRNIEGKFQHILGLRSNHTA